MVANDFKISLHGRHPESRQRSPALVEPAKEGGNVLVAIDDHTIGEGLRCAGSVGLCANQTSVEIQVLNNSLNLVFPLLAPII